MPLQEAKLSTNLRLRFRTHQENSLLFLAAGRTDYCLIALEGGRVKLNLKINEYLTEVNMPFESVWIRLISRYRLILRGRSGNTSHINNIDHFPFILSSAVVTKKGDFQRFGMARCRIAALRNECQYANWRIFHKVRVLNGTAKQNRRDNAFTYLSWFCCFLFVLLDCFFYLLLFYLWLMVHHYFFHFIFFFSLSKCIFRKTMPSQIAELNVHFGVFLGGLGDFSESYLSTVDNFRGCMSDVNVHIFFSSFFSWLFG